MTNQQHFFHHTWSALLIGLVLSAHAQEFGSPFFSQNHRQMCHCSGGKRCNSDGSCTPDICASHYYGNTCQHGEIGLVMMGTPNLDKKLLDNNDKTCLDNFNGTANFIFGSPIHYTWIYIYRENKKEIHPTLNLFYNKTPLDLSHNMYLLAISGNSWLIKLRQDVMFNEILLLQLPHDICSLEISIGRNLATSSTPYIADNFSSTMPQQAEARKAIDGIEINSCTNLIVTLELNVNPRGGQSQWWRAKLISGARLNRILVISDVRSKCGKWTFSIQYKEMNTSQMSAQSQRPDTSSDITNTEVHVRFNVSDVGLALKLAKDYHCNPGTVNICEVVMYGEFTCPDEMYGPLCETHCPHGCSRELCDPDWACPSGCKEGWNGTWCNHTCQFRYGSRCDQLCSDNCAGVGDCDTNTGQCIQGCKPGFSTAKCTKACVQGSFGLNCTQICEQCRKNKTTNAHACDPATGECLLGCSHAYGGDNCEKIFIVDDILSKVSKYQLAALTLLLILVLYKSFTRTEEEASEEGVAQGAPEKEEDKVEEVEEERGLHLEDIHAPENIPAAEDILEQGSVKEEHVEPKPKEEDKLHQPPIEIEPEEDVPEQGSHFSRMFSMIPREGSDEAVVINTQ